MKSAATQKPDLADKLEAEARYLSIPEVAVLLGRHIQVIHRWVRKGSLPHLRVMGRILIDPIQLARWIRTGGVL